MFVGKVEHRHGPPRETELGIASRTTFGSAAATMATITTPITELLGTRHPIILAGMNVASGPALAAAVSNAGGCGVVGGMNYTPAMLKEMLDDLKEGLVDKSLPFGVDLLLPKVGEGARKTNYDYTKGQLDALVDVVIDSGARLFVSAVGVPPAWAVERLHKAGILVMNMIGAPKHVSKALDAGVDIICAQGGEGGGHTGDVPTSVLIPVVADLCRGRLSPLTKRQVPVVAAGGIFDGRGLAMALSLGAAAVWVGTRFLASVEADAPTRHKEGVLSAGYHDTARTLIFTGRPLRVKRNAYVDNWEEHRREEMREALARGQLPYQVDMPNSEAITQKQRAQMEGLLMGQVAGAIDGLLPAADIVGGMMSQAVQVLRSNAAMLSKL